jgi:hypothetical protein
VIAPASIAAWSPMLEQAQAVAVGQVPPGLPAQHGRGVQQDDPFDRWVGAHLQEASDPACSAAIGSVAPSVCAPVVMRGALGPDGFSHGGEQGGLVAVLVVERAAGHPAARTISSVPTLA